MMAEQLTLIKKYLDQETNNTVIICGDFNLKLTQDIMENFISDTGLENRAANLHNTILGNFYSPRWLFHCIE